MNWSLSPWSGNPKEPTACPHKPVPTSLSPDGVVGRLTEDLLAKQHPSPPLKLRPGNGCGRGIQKRILASDWQYPWISPFSTNPSATVVADGYPGMADPVSPPASPRRSFLKEAAAGAVGACCILIPAGAAVVAWLDPLARSADGDALIPVGKLSNLPADGSPRRVTIVTSRNDGWTRDNAVPVGAVYLRRTAERTVEALHSICPHAGCFVDYVAARRMFFCPCHESTFAEDGSINDPQSPSPRPMDTLDVELRGDEVWLRFRNYRSGIQQKLPIA